MKTESFGDILFKYRQKKDMTLRELADKVGVTPAFLSMLENDKLRGTAEEETITKIAQILNIRPEKLLALARKVPKQMLDERQDAAFKFFRKDLSNKDGTSTMDTKRRT